MSDKHFIKTVRNISVWYLLYLGISLVSNNSRKMGRLKENWVGLWMLINSKKGFRFWRLLLLFVIIVVIISVVLVVLIIGYWNST